MNHGIRPSSCQVKHLGEGTELVRRKWTADIPEISVPEAWVTALDHDPASGVELACELALAIRDSGAFDGLHLIPGVRHREVAFQLEGALG